MFRDLLRNRARDELGVTAVNKLHYRAGEWFKLNSLVEEAIHHFIAGGEIRLAVETVEENAFKAIKQGQVGQAQIAQ